jgi:rSAM/selenodomain-associated transferase 1
MPERYDMTRIDRPLSGLCAMAVMAKAPLSGAVKTRLVPPLTVEEARSLSISFLRDVTENIRLAARNAPVQGYVAFAPAGTEASFAGLLAPGTRLVLADGSAEMPPNVHGIGRGLLQATRGLFALGYGSICLVNADSPTLPTAYLRDAVEALSAPGDRIVLGPAEDGGYYAVGMKRPHAELFADMPWSTEHVAAVTRERARRAGLEVVLLPSWYDVDDRVTLKRLQREISSMGAKAAGLPAPYPAPATVECIMRLGIAGTLESAGMGEPASASARGTSA